MTRLPKKDINQQFTCSFDAFKHVLQKQNAFNKRDLHTI